MSGKSVSAFAKVTAFFTALGSSLHRVFVNTSNRGFISSREFHKRKRAFAEVGGTDNVEFIAGHTVEDGLIHYAEETNVN